MYQKAITLRGILLQTGSSRNIRISSHRRPIFLIRRSLSSWSDVPCSKTPPRPELVPYTPLLPEGRDAARRSCSLVPAESNTLWLVVPYRELLPAREDVLRAAPTV
jgi:hypothetical protein